MAKNFGKSPAAKRFDEIAKNTMANTNTESIVLIENSKLLNYPDNGEDIAYTADIENSIGELGFTDPLEVTDYAMSGGQYMIVSGHRRRAAGVKCGMNLFPCIIKPFKNKTDLHNYVLLANSHRDSSKDLLLYCKRYKLHEQHLKSVKFQGSVREEIAKRLGISVQQADRYNQMNKIIAPVWDLVRDDAVGMSSVLPMAVLTLGEQQEILEILKAASDSGIELTRGKVREIIENYKGASPHREDGAFGEQTETIGKMGGTGNISNSLKTIKSIHAQLQKAGVFEAGFERTEEAQMILAELQDMRHTLENIVNMLAAERPRD